jgi:hypothetical protein
MDRWRGSGVGSVVGSGGIGLRTCTFRCYMRDRIGGRGICSAGGIEALIG